MEGNIKNKYCFALDLKNDIKKIQEYKQYHKNVWPQIIESMKKSGINYAEIYNTRNRLFMIIEVNEHFSIDKKSEMDLKNPKVQEWEKLMWNFQESLPNTPPGTKWVLMDKIFDLSDY
tara:strand:+ start:184 stop:537 length:354 start_codon:yes stop_codon:yes gene_type:complete